MSDPPTEAFDVPVRAVERHSRSRARAWIASLIVVGLVAAALGLAAQNRSGEAIAIAPSAPPAPPARLGGTSTIAPALPTPRQELPLVENIPLLDGPIPAFIVRDGTSAEIHAWTPGEPVRVIRTFPDAYMAAEDDPQFVAVSPNGQFTAVFSTQPSASLGSDHVRLVTEDDIIWERDRVAARPGLAWSATSDRFALIGDPTSLILGEVNGQGLVAEREVVLAAEPVLGSGYAALGFSLDGGSVIVAHFNDATQVIEPAFRVGFTDEVIERIDTFPTGPDRVAASGQQHALVDPLHGRTLRFPDYLGAGPSMLSVVGVDGDAVFSYDVGSVVGADWDDAGRLAILTGDSLEDPSPFSLVRVDQNGQSRELFRSPVVARAALLGVRNGYAGVALQTDEPRRQTQLLLVGMLDGLVTGVEVGPFREGPDGATWIR